jgi:hypothetical protein
MKWLGSDRSVMVMNEIAPNRKKLIDLGYEDAVIFRNPDYDSAIIGVSDEDRVVYDYDEMIASLMLEDDMTIEEAMDFINYNTIRALPYAGADGPIIIYKFDF